MIDTKTGLVKTARNHLVASNSSLLESLIPITNESIADDDEEDEAGGKSPSPKRVGYLKAKLNNFINTSVKKEKKKVRLVTNIKSVDQLLENAPLTKNHSVSSQGSA